jgi:CheY-like chemotaxis protein
MEVIALYAGADEQQINVYFLSDVDQLQRARHDAEQLRSVAEQANTAKNDFLSRMSHELRTPLNAILGFTQLLELDELEPSQEEAVGQILRAGRHLLGLINVVLDISRIETGRLAVSAEPVPVAEVFDQAWELVAITASQRGIVVRIDPPLDRTLHVRADQQRLKQVFVNLLSNAVKYSVRDTQILVGHELRDARLRIVVRDAGPGISQEKVARLFQPFERLGLDSEVGAAEGVGLGLALSKALVEAMNGAIGVDSEPGAGSRFWVELDVVSAPDDAVVVAPGPLSPAADLGTILYIEDNSSNLRLVERILEHRPGIRLVGATTGDEGFERARELNPEIILLDLDLPDMRGERVLDRLRGEKWGREIPVVVLSADATPGLARNLAQHGASAHMTKPVDVQRLLDLVDDLLAAPV